MHVENDPDVARGARSGIVADTAPIPPRGIAALFSCSAGERAYEHATLRHGVFFQFVLEAMEGAATDVDGDITLYSLASYVNKRVPDQIATIMKADVKQSPNLKANLSGRSPVLVPKSLVAKPNPNMTIGRLANRTRNANLKPMSAPCPSHVAKQSQEEWAVKLGMSDTYAANSINMEFR